MRPANAGSLLAVPHVGGGLIGGASLKAEDFLAIAMAAPARGDCRPGASIGMVALSKIPVRMSVAEFLAWHPEDRRQWQLVDGEPQAMAPASSTHARIQAEVARLIRDHLLERRSPCDVLVAPGIVPRVQASHNVRVPDLAVTCSPASSPMPPLLDDPVLVIEILSPSNQAETWSNVWTYTSIPSVQEILVHSGRPRSARTSSRRHPDGTWPELPLRAARRGRGLASIGMRAPLAAFYRTTHLARA